MRVHSNVSKRCVTSGGGLVRSVIELLIGIFALSTARRSTLPIEIKNRSIKTADEFSAPKVAPIMDTTPSIKRHQTSQNQRRLNVNATDYPDQKLLPPRNKGCDAKSL